MWNVETISGYNHPNVLYDNPDIIPGAITRDFIEGQFKKAGGNKKHFFYAPPVEGEYSDSASDSLIKREWILKSMARWKANNRVPDYRGTALALDIAGTGGDASSMLGMKDFRAFRPMITAEFCKKPTTKELFPSLRPGPTWMRGRESQESVDMVFGAVHCVPDVRVVVLDAGGLGDGPTGQLQRERTKKFPKYLKYVPHPRLIQRTEEHQADVIGYKFGEAPIQPAARKFKKFKDQILWFLREGFREDRIDIPPPEVWASYGVTEADIMEELTRPFFGIDAKDHLIVVDKSSAETPGDEESRKRADQLPSASPNELHALALVFWQFCRLSPGMKPIEDNRELQRLEMDRLTKKAAKDHLGRPARRRGALPWHRR